MPPRLASNEPPDELSNPPPKEPHTERPNSSPDGHGRSVTLNGRTLQQRQRPHVCKFCQRRFLRAEHLQRHVTSHENRKPFACQDCGARYGRADVLQRHRKKCPSQLNHPPAILEDGADANEESILSTPRQSGSTHRTAASLVCISLASAGDVNQEMPDASIENAKTDHHTQPLDELNTPRDSMASSHSDELADSVIIVDSENAPDQTHDVQFRATAQADQAPLDSTITVSDRDIFTQPHPGEPFAASALQPLTPPLNLDSRTIPSQTLESLLRQDGSLECLPPFEFDDSIFLEDTLLPEFDFNILENLTFFSTPQSLTNILNVPDVSTATEILSSRTRHVTPTPSPNNAPELQPEYAAAKQPFQAIRCSDDDVTVVQNAISQANALVPNLEAKIPSKSRVSRILNAYFEYFDPHTPIVHRPTFVISSTPGPLLLAMLAVGGCYLSEHEFAYKAFEASCRLLSQYEAGLLAESTSELWPIQATLLCVQVGGFSSNPRYLRQAQRHISLVTDLLRTAESDVRDGWASAYSDWRQWIYIETLSRLACWTSVLNAVILMFDPEAICLAAPQPMSQLPIPSNDGLWRTSSTASWSHSKELQSYSPKTIMEAVRKARWADPTTTPVSSFALLAYIGSLLLHICGRERSLYGLDSSPSKHTIFSIEKSLKAWETLWRRHPHAESVPSKHGDPLMADCLSLLGSAYYHLYMGPELQTLKTIARDSQCQLAIPSFRPQRETLKAVRYAASSWLVRAKLGITHLQATAALEFGGHVLVTAYEGALVLIWWLNIRTHPEYEFPIEKEIADNIRTLDELFDEIIDEVNNQGFCCDSSETHPALIPLEFYCVLMRKWVWSYSVIMAQNLQSFAARLTPQQL
ncbi:hypothetical protein EDB80DRAFT_729080 [Ilyonectria destructans]|nr:hypothetical protein EDB80DRAFT_729080 [Ilyonectria destructans]